MTKTSHFILRSVFGFALSGLAFTASVLVVPAPVAQAACAALPSDKGQAVFTVTIPSTATYRVWSRVWVPSAGNDGFYMQIDQTVCNTMVGNGGTMPAGQFTWVDWVSGNSATKFSASLTAGSHTVVVAGADPSVGIDKIMFLSDGCVPTGDGTNCQAAATATPVAGSATPTPTPLAVGNNSSTVPVSGVVNLEGNSSASIVEYTVDGKKIDGSTLDTTTLSDGKHTVVVTERAPDGTVTTKTQTIVVQNGWQYRLVAGMKQNWPWVVGIVIGVVALAGAGVMWWQFRSRRAVSAAPLTAKPEPVQSDAGSNSHPV